MIEFYKTSQPTARCACGSTAAFDVYTVDMRSFTPKPVEPLLVCGACLNDPLQYQFEGSKKK